MAIDGAEKPIPSVEWSNVSPGYFRTMGIPLVQGRYFAYTDRQGAESVAIVNEAFAARYCPDRGCLGQRIKNWTKDKDLMTVVGVVGDTRPTLEEQAVPELFLPFLQAPDPRMSIVVQANGDPMDVSATVRAQILAMDRNVPPYDMLPLQQRLEAATEPRWVNTLLLGTFAALAVVLGFIGVYGLLSYSVTQRMHEVGVRTALGAQRKDIVIMIVRQGLLLVAAGEAIGVGGAFLLNGTMKSMVFHIKPTDVYTYTAVIVGWLLIGLLAGCVPAYKAATIDPLMILRSE